jgi:hypothetical protein
MKNKQNIGYDSAVNAGPKQRVAAPETVGLIAGKTRPRPYFSLTIRACVGILPNMNISVRNGNWWWAFSAERVAG